MMLNDERPQWKAYPVRHIDMHGYETVQYGVREEYADGATRYIHNEVKATREEAQIMATLFNLHVRKGKTYDNTMKRWN